MRDPTDICLRTTRSSTVRPIRASSARRPSSAIPRFNEMKLCLDDESREEFIDDPSTTSARTMNVYLRMKPRPAKFRRIKKNQENMYIVADETTLLAKFPSLDGNTSCGKNIKSPEALSRKYTFTKIFSADCTQSEFFEQTVKQRIVDLFGGQSFTFMTYGTTNSGKTYTLYGNRESPGIIPRSIEFVFSGVNCTLTPWYKPSNVCEVVALNDTGRCQENEARETLLTSRSMDKSFYEEAYGSLENSMKEDRECGKNGEAMYSVWLSFVEIYNDNIYDLLINDETRTKLAPLKLVKDKQGRPFVQGSRTICATTGLEAYRIMMAGRSRLTVGSTSLNPSSSRSHSIFTMTLLKYAKERAPEDVETTTMTFCDLAGTGRSRKSSAIGSELKEAKNINTSLLVLGRCLKGASESRMTRQSAEVVGPFRESKLTRLFQRGISGKENLCFIVNIDTCPDLHLETQAVLTFASMAKKIVIDIAKDAKHSGVSESNIPSPRELSIRERVRPTTVAVIETPRKSAAEVISNIEQLTQLNATLTKEITILRESALNREYEIRQEMANLYTNIIKDVDANWQKRTKDVEIEHDDFLKWSVKQIEIFYKERIDSLTNRKRRRTSGGDQLNDGKELCEVLEAENSQITAKVVALRQTIKKLKEEQDSLNADKNRCVFELSLAKDVIKKIRQLVDDERGERIVINADDDDARVLEDLKSLIEEKNETIMRLKKSLDVARNQQVEGMRNPLENMSSEIDSESTDNAEASILKALTREQLETELTFRKEPNSRDKQSIGIQVFEESIIIQETQIDTKFSSSTFKKESDHVFLPSSTRYSVVEGENSILAEETTCTIDATISSRYSSSQDNDSMKRSHISFLDTIENAFCSSAETSSKDDSGIGITNAMSSSTDNSLSHVTEEKSSQANFDDVKNKEEINEIIQERIERLKIDYTKLKAEHLRETLRVTELSEEVVSIKHSLGGLKESIRHNERKILDYQEKLASRDRDLSSLGQSKFEMERQLYDISKKLESRSIVYEEKIDQLCRELKIHENNENRAFESLEECQEKTSLLENQLSAAHEQLDQNSIKCFTEHIPKIDILEKELSAKSQRISELNETISKYENDLALVYQINDRVTNFVKIFDEYQAERDELRRQLAERSETQTAVECKIKRLMSKVHERENEISSLKMNLGNVVKMNIENSDRARDLSKEIAIEHDRLANVKDEMTRSEEERRKLERTSAHEIGNLIARLTEFEKNTATLARMRDNEDSRMDELDTVKLLLHEKEREMSLFKKNRDKTIRRYEALIRKLQADVEMRCNRESSKLRMLYPKRSISKDSLRSVGESVRWKTTLRRSVEKVRSSQGIVEARNCRRLQSSDCCNPRCTRTYPTCSMIIKRSSSKALAASSTSLEGSRSSGSKRFPFHYDVDDDDDDEDSARHGIIETESRADLNLDIVECRGCGRRDGLSQAAATFSIPSTSDDSFTDFCDVPEWMEIRRTNGRTHFRLRKADSGIESEAKPRI